MNVSQRKCAIQMLCYYYDYYDYLIILQQRKITFSFVPVTPQVRLRPVALDIKGLSENPRCSQKRSLLL